MATGITPLLLDIERLRQTARAVNKATNEQIEKIVFKQRDEYNIVYDDTEIKKLSKLSNITWKIMKDLDDAETKILNDFKLGD